jgi:hypothetical protein
MNHNFGSWIQVALAGALLLPTNCMAAAERAQVIVRVERHGSGLMQYYTTFELHEDGVLELTRRAPSGGTMEKRSAHVEAGDLDRYRDLLTEGDYYSTETGALNSSLVSTVLNEIQDNPGWRVEVFRDGATLAITVVPPQNAARRRPELKEIPYVRSAWALIEEFEKRWAQAKKVEP